MITFNEQAKCFKYGSVNIDYGQSDFQGEGICYEYHCPICGHDGKEWYRLEWIEQE